ncbi:peptidase inhibitor family I36 protein [Streptomyces sp. B1866]|uniref:peptidase inhibitor family I36 protein n=1 Tax=Streptomyces sp. B1866 TaxID=3075431 RepID=UPI002890DE13|nr:peptidase inhibitor family I36 protein [Streptomyces sp. B1866]MDT3399592.1 peptidase inhibitor family I36 protein [Streptomyces sp. B1866]
MSRTRPITAAGVTSAVVLTAAAGAVLAAVSAALSPAPAEASPPRLGPCATGQLCLWHGSAFSGAREVRELADTDIEECVRLSTGTAASLANRTRKPVTTYQSAECAETGDFATYPSGTWVPESPYQVRAVKIWER